MKKVRYVETNLFELGELTTDTRSDLAEDGFYKAFAGSVAGEGCRIPAADTGKEIYFGDRELLVRFTAMSMHEQLLFLRSVRKTMAEEDVQGLRIQAPWGGQQKRVIDVRVDIMNNPETLIFNLV